MKLAKDRTPAGVDNGSSRPYRREALLPPLTCLPLLPLLPLASLVFLLPFLLLLPIAAELFALSRVRHMH